MTAETAGIDRLEEITSLSPYVCAMCRRMVGVCAVTLWFRWPRHTARLLQESLGQRRRRRSLVRCHLTATELSKLLPLLRTSSADLLVGDRTVVRMSYYRTVPAGLESRYDTIRYGTIRYIYVR